MLVFVLLTWRSKLSHHILPSHKYLKLLLEESDKFVIQGDQNVSSHPMITIQKVRSSVQSVPRQSPDIYWRDCVLEDRVQYSTVHIPNLFCDGHLQLINYVVIVIVRCTETFWSPCIRFGVFSCREGDKNISKSITLFFKFSWSMNTFL
jgi:hypothetical protein